MGETHGGLFKYCSLKSDLGELMKKLIVNADDFGFDDETVDWTIRGFEQGKITSATVMAGMPATERAVAYAKV